MQKNLLHKLIVLFFAALSVGAVAQNPGSCVAPSITTLVPDSNKVAVSWLNNSMGTTGSINIIEYTSSPYSSSSVWNSVTVNSPGTTFVVNGLSSCKTYVFRMKSLCSTTVSSPYSSLKDVKTLGCATTAVCSAPVINTVVADSTKATVTWYPAVTAPATGNYTVEYTASPLTNGSVWQSVNTTGSTVTINGLQMCTTYLFRVKANCSPNLSSAYSSIRDSKTKGCVVITPCNAPYISSVSSDSTKATVSWVSNNTASTTTYTLEYTAAPQTSSSVWTAVNTSSLSATINGLQTCTGYLFRVKANCSATQSSAYSDIKDTKTKGCVVITPCNAPYISTIVADSTKATVSWVSNNSSATTTYTLEYTAAPQTSTSVWTAVNSNSLSATVSGLQMCTAYLFRVKANCSANQSSAYSSVKDATTKGCALPCYTPIVGNIIADSTKVALAWSSSNSGGNFTVEYTTTPVSNTSVWTAVNINGTNAVINGLQVCTGYVFRVKANCSATSSSPWSSLRDTKTKGCPVVIPCPTPAISTIVADSTKATVNWSTSGATAATSYTIEYTISQQTTQPVWTAVTSNTNSITITGLQICTGYLFRVKANCSTTSSSAWSSIRDTKTKGCPVVVPCTSPVIGNVSSDSTSATISWASTNSAPVGYTVEYTLSPVSSSNVWTSATVIGNTFTATGLSKCKEYVFRVKANCSATTSSGWSSLRGVVTKGCPVTAVCVKPYNLSNVSTQNGVVLSWAGNGIMYQVRYKKSTSLNAAWIVVDSITAKTLSIGNLANCTRYIWQVRALCSNSVWSSWSDLKVFGTLGCPRQQSLVISPNPGSQFTVFYTLESEAKVTFDVIDMQGRLVKQFDAGLVYSGDNIFNMEESDLTSGLYFVVLKVNGIQQDVQRWIKE